MRKAWYHLEGSKKAELWTILHLPYTLMCIAFLAVGFAIHKPVNWELFGAAILAYFLGLGLAAHAFDQLSLTGSRYVKYLTRRELLAIGISSLITAIAIGVFYMVKYSLWHLIWLIPLQAIFAIGYPIGETFRGKLHNDISFSFSFGALPPLVGFYVNTGELSLVVLPFMVLCGLVAYIEILLSRQCRRLRKELREGIIRMGDLVFTPRKDSIPAIYRDLIEKPEKALKVLCLLSYVLPFCLFVF